MTVKKHTFLTALTSVCFTLFLISLAVVVTLNFRPLYYHDMKQMQLSQLSGLSEEEIKENYDVLIDYNSMFYQGELNLPTLPMSESGRIHFEEVRRIFVSVQYLCLVSFLACLGLTVVSVRQKTGWKFLKFSSLLTVILPVVLGVLIAWNWDRFFITFHHLFFRNDYWIFDPKTDPIITILPDTFFLHCALMILICVVASSLLMAILYYVLTKSSYKSSLKNGPASP